jgi:hypothetical protein
MPVEAAMGQADFAHQVGDAETFDATLPHDLGRLPNDPLFGRRRFVPRFAHARSLVGAVPNA